MLSKILKQVTTLTQSNKYLLLSHKKMNDLKKQIYGNQKVTFNLKAKFFLKEVKYTIVQGCKDLWFDYKWMIHLYKTKSRFQFTGYEIMKTQRVFIDLLKFIPYSVILVVPFAQLSLPIILYLYPNAIPTCFIFDTASCKSISIVQKIQQNAHKVLFQKLLKVLQDLNLKQQQFTHYDEFKNDFFQVIKQIDEKLDYNNFSSDQLITVLQFMGGDYFEGTTTITKIVNFFTGIIPRWLFYKPLRYLFYKILRKDIPTYRDPWWIKQDFKIFDFNYQPFQQYKKKYLLWQINRKYTALKEQDLAFERYGMNDVKDEQINLFARNRGLASIACYKTLKNIIYNDWVKLVAHPYLAKNNTKLWYSVMLYNFLAKSNKDHN